MIADYLRTVATDALALDRAYAAGTVNHAIDKLAEQAQQELNNVANRDGGPEDNAPVLRGEASRAGDANVASSVRETAPQSAGDEGAR